MTSNGVSNNLTSYPHNLLNIKETANNAVLIRTLTIVYCTGVNWLVM